MLAVPKLRLYYAINEVIRSVCFNGLYLNSHNILHKNLWLIKVFLKYLTLKVLAPNYKNSSNMIKMMILQKCNKFDETSSDIKFEWHRWKYASHFLLRSECNHLNCADLSNKEHLKAFKIDNYYVIKT